MAAEADNEVLMHVHTRIQDHASKSAHAALKCPPCKWLCALCKTPSNHPTILLCPANPPSPANNSSTALTHSLLTLLSLALSLSVPLPPPTNNHAHTYSPPGLKGPHLEEGASLHELAHNGGAGLEAEPHEQDEVGVPELGQGIHLACPVMIQKDQTRVVEDIVERYRILSVLLTCPML